MAPLLTGAFVAGYPCLSLGVAGSSRSLTCQIDISGDYELLLLPTVASTLNYIPGFFPFNLRLLDGRICTTRRGKLDLALPWQTTPTTINLRIFNRFLVTGHPPLIDGFLGRDFFAGRSLFIDYSAGSVHLS